MGGLICSRLRLAGSSGGGCRDCREQGGRANSATKEQVVSLVTLHGREYLHYRAPRIAVAVLRGTTADEAGNVTFERECFYADALNQATPPPCLSEKQPPPGCQCSADQWDPHFLVCTCDCSDACKGRPCLALSAGASQA